MLKRHTTTLDSTFAILLRAVERFTRRLMPATPGGRPAGGPVVFRHYL